MKRRAENKLALSKHFGFDATSGPIFSVVSRLTWQKGMDVLAETIDDIVENGGKLAVLGSGDPVLENAFLAASRPPPRPGRHGHRL